MTLAIFPPNPSESLEDGLALVDQPVIRPINLDPLDEAIHDVDVIIVELSDQPMRRLREAKRISDEIGIPIFLVVEPDQLAMLDSTTSHRDFQVAPIDPIEFRIRINTLLVQHSDDELLTFKDLSLNTLTYQADLAGEPMDLTYVEYELLRFLVGNPIRVWSREQLLSRVWGYEYYGGARTVDVHVRRLRAKLGEERASWIATVRSVGYRFG
ncbi:MAG TPA: response regulator transcription factor [Acidimicrobiia bacterium]